MFMTKAKGKEYMIINKIFTAIGGKSSYEWKKLHANYIKMPILVISGKSDNRYFLVFFVVVILNSLKYTCIHY